MNLRALLRAAVVIALTTIGCGGSTTTPTSPTPAPSTPTASLAIESLSASADRGATAGYIYRITFVLREMRGAPATITGATVTLTNGTSTIGSGTVSAGEVATSTTVAANGTVQSNRISLTDAKTDATLATRLTVAVTYSDSAGRAGSATAGADITAPPAAPAPPTPPPAPTMVVLTGRVTADATGVSGATVRFLDGPNSGRSTTTDSSGNYRFADLTLGNSNLSATASGYTEDRRGTFVNGTNTLNFVLQRTQLWSQSGQGNNVFDKPSYISRVRITGSYSGYSSNFVVYCGGRLIVNELLGTGWGTTTYSGTHQLGTCTPIEITMSTGVSWSFTEVR